MTTAEIANLHTAVRLNKDRTKTTRLQGIILTHNLPHNLRAPIPTQHLNAAVHLLHHVRAKATLPRAVLLKARAEVLPLQEVHRLVQVLLQLLHQVLHQVLLQDLPAAQDQDQQEAGDKLLTLLFK